MHEWLVLTVNHSFVVRTFIRSKSGMYTVKIPMVALTKVPTRLSQWTGVYFDTPVPMCDPNPPFSSPTHALQKRHFSIYTASLSASLSLGMYTILGSACRRRSPPQKNQEGDRLPPHDRSIAASYTAQSASIALRPQYARLEQEKSSPTVVPRGQLNCNRVEKVCEILTNYLSLRQIRHCAVMSHVPTLVKPSQRSTGPASSATIATSNAS